MLTSDKDFNNKSFRGLLSEYEHALSEGSIPFLDDEEFEYIAEYYHSEGHTDKSLEAINNGLEFHTGSATLLAFMVRYDINCLNDISAAYKHLDEIEDTENLDYVFSKAEILLASEFPYEANDYMENFYNNMNDEDDQNYFAFDTANLFFDYEETDLAEKWLELSNEKDNADYLDMQGGIACWKENYDEAESIYHQLLDEYPFSTDYWDKLAHIQHLKEDFEGAIASSEYSLAINPNNLEAKYQIAASEFRLNNTERAYNMLSEICQSQPEHPAIIYLTVCAKLLGKEDEYKENLAKAMVLYPDNMDQILGLISE